jgi:hypothetical protein
MVGTLRGDGPPLNMVVRRGSRQERARATRSWFGVKRTARLSPEKSERLYNATRSSLREWINRLRAEVADAFPEKVTAFHPAMKVGRRPPPRFR